MLGEVKLKRTANVARICATLLFPGICGSATAGECTPPLPPTIGSDRIGDLTSRTASASYWGDACEIDNDLFNQFGEFVRVAYPGEITTQQSVLDDFRRRKQSLVDDVGLMALGKACYLDGSTTRGTLRDLAAELAQSTRAWQEEATRYNQANDLWAACVARERAAAEARAAEARRSADEAAYLASEEYQRRKAVEDLEAGFRPSLLNSGTYVLGLHNVGDRTADFKLKCFTTAGTSKTFYIALAPNQSKEIGFLEGWPGNFVRGEYCVANYQGDDLWRVSKK